MTFRSSLLAFAAAATPLAQAHVTLEYQVALAGSAYKATFKVGHGCGDSATRQIAVSLPAGVRNARPMPKPGWTIEITPEQIRWTARSREDALPATQYDEFVLVAQMPKEPGPIYWPVSQVCEQGRSDWVEVPRGDQKLSDLKSPAAYLEVLPSGPATGHHH